MSEVKYARIYGRFSSSKQEDGDSERRQVEGAIAYAARCKPPLVILEKPYFDRAVSGKDGANLQKELGRLLGEAKPGECLLVENMDRLGRQDPKAMMNLIDKMVNGGLSVYVWGDGKVYDKDNQFDLATILTTLIQANTGYEENRKRIKRIGESAAVELAKAEKGIHSATLMRFLPQCYLWDGSKSAIVIDEDRAASVRFIFEQYCNGVGKTTICKELNQKGVPTFYRQGEKRTGPKKWIECSVKSIIRNRCYAGVLTVKGKEYECIPPVVSKEQFSKAQLRMAAWKGRMGNHSGGRVNNLFSGFGVCAACNGPITVNVTSDKKRRGGKSYYSYRCGNARNGGCSAKKMLAARYVELGFFEGYFGATPEKAFKIDDSEQVRKCQLLEEAIANGKRKEDNLLEMVEEGHPSAKELYRKRAKENEGLTEQLQLERARLTELTEIPTAVEKISQMIGTVEGDKLLENFYPQLEQKLQDNAIRKKLVNALPSVLSKVIFDTVKGEITAFDKNGAELECKFLPFEYVQQYQKRKALRLSVEEDLKDEGGEAITSEEFRQLGEKWKKEKEGLAFNEQANGGKLAA